MDSLCRALLDRGVERKDRADLLEARHLCESAKAGIEAAGDSPAGTVDNLAKIAAAIEALP